MPTLRELLLDFDPLAGLSLPPQWLQGRTAYGGITTATALAAARALSTAALPPLRSAQVSFIAPATGLLRYQVQPLRLGRSVCHVGVDVNSQDGLVARLQLVFGQGRPSRVVHDFCEQPPVRGPESYPAINAAGLAGAIKRPPFVELDVASVVPAFLANFELRPAAGSLPVAAADNPEIVAWIRHLDAADVDPVVALVALADALPPAAFTAYQRPAPVSSINWSFDLLGAPPEGQWFLLRSASQYAAEGYSSQQMQVWDIQGRLLMQGRQSVALFE